MGIESKGQKTVSTQGTMPQHMQENSSNAGTYPGLLPVTTKKGFQKGISKVPGFQEGGNSLKPLKDMGSTQLQMTVRVGQGWTEALTSSALCLCSDTGKTLRSFPT